MNYTYEIRRQAETAPRAALPAVASALWKAFGEGHLSEAEAEALSGLIEARQLTERPTELHQRSTDTPRKAVGSRPRNRMPRWPAVAAGQPLGGFHRLSLLSLPWRSRRCWLLSRWRS
jgi:hypothetical protein